MQLQRHEEEEHTMAKRVQPTRIGPSRPSPIQKEAESSPVEPAPESANERALVMDHGPRRQTRVTAEPKNQRPDLSWQLPA